MCTIPAVALTHNHIGATIAGTPPDTDDTSVTGILRWFTVTSDLVIVAIEEDLDGGAVEWEFPLDAELRLLAPVEETNAELRPHVDTGSPVRSVLDLSTAHLPEHVCRDLNGYDGVTAHEFPFGWLLWVPEDPGVHAANYRTEVGPGDPEGDRYGWPPSEVLAIQRHARRLGCDYVLLDRDAPKVGDLPTWDW